MWIFEKFWDFIEHNDFFVKKNVWWNLKKGIKKREFNYLQKKYQQKSKDNGKKTQTISYDSFTYMGTFIQSPSSFILHVHRFLEEGKAIQFKNFDIWLTVKYCIDLKNNPRLVWMLSCFYYLTLKKKIIHEKEGSWVGLKSRRNFELSIS